MNTRERFLATMHGEPGSHTVKWEFGYWTGTLRRWYAQGLPRVKGISDDVPDGKGVKGELQGRTPSRTFDEDVHDAMNMDETNEAIPIEAFIHPPFERIVLEDHDNWQIVRHTDGTIVQERKDGLSVPSFLQGPISNADEWHKLRDERLIPGVRDRLVTNWETWSNRVQERTHTVSAVSGTIGLYSGLRALFGDEQVLFAFYDQPDLVREIVNYLVEFWMSLYDPLLSHVQADFALLTEDMAYKNGPLISPEMFRAFLLEPYSKLVGFFRNHGIDIVLVDSDGDVRKLIPLFLEAGVTGLLPFEVTAGQDIAEVRREYPDLQILGGIDKKAVALGREAIDLELAKVPDLLEQGRFVPFIDHNVHPGVSWEDFQYYRTRLDEMINIHAST